MAQFRKHFEQDLGQEIVVRQCGAVCFNADNLSNVLSVSLFENGAAAVLTGYTAAGAVICSDGSTVLLDNGSISGNTVSVTLTAACFAIPGQIGVGIQLVNGHTKTTVLKAIYHVDRYITDNVVDPDGRITLSVSDLIAKIDAATAEIPCDVVADHSELLTIDTEHLPDRHTVKVLADETHYNKRTYYRWDIVGTSGAWTYVGADDSVSSVTSTAATTITIGANVTNVVTGTPTALSVTLEDPNESIDTMYGLIFKAGASFALTETAPEGCTIVWGDEPTWTEGAVYEVVYRYLHIDGIISAKYSEILTE